ncbi:hypothetical protein GCM10022291_00310 [Postechiella marina]|uniref:Uncharacterized protein n=1 Tax=Postechiella marina TaxID=943941 RepID=A0ABP8BYA9_9FLAO
MPNINNRVLLLTSVFFILCCGFQYFNIQDGIFSVNLFAEISFFIIFIKYKKIKAWSIFLFWLFFTLSGLAIFIYRDIAYSEITTSLKLLGYFMLLIYVFPKQKKNKISKSDFLIYTLIFIINLYVIYEVINMISDFVSAKHMITLFTIYGFVLIFLYMSAFRYRLLHNSRSKYFLLLASFLTVAEILGILGYFLEYTFMFYLEFFFYLFGLCCGVISFIDEDKGDSLHKLIKTGNI